jgi:hypothetical protein
LGKVSEERNQNAGEKSAKISAETDFFTVSTSLAEGE